MDILLEDIHKTYGRVQANAGISMHLEPGRIYGLLGENGAGKSTLMRVLAGHTIPDRGRVVFDGKDTGHLTPKSALKLGVGMLYQDPLDFPAMKVWENFQLGAPPRSRKDAVAELEKWGKKFDFSLQPEGPVSELTVGERQQLEIVRLLDAGVKTLILDEPTTGISLPQKKKLFATLKKLASEPDRVLIIVTHKLEEAKDLCDQLFVMRGGRLEGSLKPPLRDEDILTLMFGEEALRETEPKTKCALDENPILSLSDAEFVGDKFNLRVNLELSCGEIVGLAGLEGNGQGVLLRGLAGLTRMSGGSLTFDQKEIGGKPYLQYRRAGIHFLPAARMEQGLFPELSLADHISLAFPDQKKRLEEFYREECVNRFRLMADPGVCARMLSGGNQQRLLLSLIPKQTRLLLMEHPTRGLDLGSARQVWSHLEERCGDGASLIFASADLDEIMAHSHRILVFYNRKIIAEIPADDARLDLLGSLMAGKEQAA